MHDDPLSDSAAHGLRTRLGAWIELPRVQWCVIAVILVNAATLGAETSPAAREAFGPWLRALDAAALTVFVAELAIKLFAFGPRFFRSGWNVFDFIVVGIALMPASGPLAVLRALRVLRVLRLVSAVPQLRFVVEALLKAVPGIAAIGGLLLILLYVSAVIVVGLFGPAHPEWFGSLDRALYTLFQVMTLDSWSSGITRTIMEEQPLAWLFFVPFVLIASFTMLNLFVAVIVNAMDTLRGGLPTIETPAAGGASGVPGDAPAVADRSVDAAVDGRGGAGMDLAPPAVLLEELRALRSEVAVLNARLADQTHEKR